MKFKLTTCAALMLLALNSCKNEEIINNNIEKEELNRTLSITARMPDKGESTRIAFTKDEYENVILTWENQDPIQLCFVQGDLRIIAQTRVEEISGDGTTAKFKIKIPEQITGDFTLYGLYGPDNTLKVKNGEVVATLPTDILEGRQLEEIKNRKQAVMTFKAENVSKANPSVSIDFNHIGSLFNIRIKNESTEKIPHHIIKLAPHGASDAGWVYNNGWIDDNHFGADYNMENGTFVNGTTAANYIALAFKDDTGIPAETTVDFWAWYPPSTTKTWPELKLHLCDKNLLTGELETKYTTRNTRKARATALNAGKIYRLYAVWNGEYLKFSDKTLQFGRPKMALEYVAEFNVAEDGKSFTDSHQNDKSGYFNWYKASGTYHAEHNPNSESIGSAFNGHHVPTHYELFGIFPKDKDVYYGSDLSRLDKKEEITVHGKNNTYSGDYLQAKNTTYALRFKKTTTGTSDFPAAKDNNMLCAFRYRITGEFEEGNLNSRLEVTCRYLGKDFLGSVRDIAKESFWRKNNKDDVKRTFPICGRIDLDLNKVVFVGEYGRYYASTQNKTYQVRITYQFARTWDIVDYPEEPASIRLFSDN